MENIKLLSTLKVFICVVLSMQSADGYTILPLDYEDTELPRYPFPFVSRHGWNAGPPLQKTPLETPVPFVVIHHTYTPGACNSRDECNRAMKSMQAFHVDERGWWDIGYNFCVGGDGSVYEGRGWDTVGAHALHFNTVSIGICLIGNWNETIPSSTQTDLAQSLIAAGVDQGFVRIDYKLTGHRQVRDTECPGQALYTLIQTWPHYTAGNFTRGNTTGSYQ